MKSNNALVGIALLFLALAATSSVGYGVKFPHRSGLGCSLLDLGQVSRWDRWLRVVQND